MASSSFHRLVQRRTSRFGVALRATWCGRDAIPGATSTVQLPALPIALASGTHIRQPLFRKLSASSQSGTRGTPLLVAADAFTVTLAVCLGVAAVGGSYVLLKGPRNKIVKVSLKAEEVSYLCEGGSSILCAYVGSRLDWRGWLLQLAKQGADSSSREDIFTTFRRRSEIPRGLSLHCFHRDVIDCPELVSLPEEFIGDLDAALFSTRPADGRDQRLRQDDSVRRIDRIIALRYRNLFEAPPRHRHSWLRSVADSVTLPLLTVEFRPGCGVQEVAGVPSRDALRMEVELGGSSPMVQQLDPLALYSNEATRIAANLQARLNAPSETAALKIFIDGRPVHPSALPEASAGEASPLDLQGLVRSCGIKCSIEDLLSAVSKALASGGSSLADLRRLQCFAAGESEKIAGRLFKDLQKHSGHDCISSLSSIDSIQAAIRRASRRESDKDRLDNHLNRGRKLMAITKWGDRQVSDVKEWLSLFLLGRTCFEARVLVSFTVVQENVDSAYEKQLRAFRFRPLKELLPGRPWSHNVWACVTVTGLDRCDPSQIPHVATELEDLVRMHSESVGKK